MKKKITLKDIRTARRNAKTSGDSYTKNSAPEPASHPSDNGADSAAAAVNSGGATSPQVLKDGRYKITIREDRKSGWWERDGEAIGHLIFDSIPAHDSAAIELVDYDGVFELPKTVARLLREANIHVDTTFTS